MDEQPYGDIDLSLEEALARLMLLAELSNAMTSTLDTEDAAQRLVRLVVPQFADWCAVDLLEDGRVRRIAAAHGDPRALLPSGPSEALPVSQPARAPLTRVLQGAGPLLLEGGELDRDFGDDPVHEVQRRLYRMLDARSVMLAPLRARQQVLGALTLVRTDPDTPFSRDDLPMAEEITHRAALAVDNARLYSEQQHIAERLQRSLLPRLPDVDHLDMAADYLAARESAQVGGDWYDAFVLADGVTTLVIGDVVGHDTGAAVIMAQARNMLRSLTWDRQEPPGEILHRLEGALGGIAGGPLITVVLARLEGPPGGPWQLHWSCAGHPPPLLVTREGDAEFLEGGHGAILGVLPQQPRPSAIRPLPPGSTLLLYTDGLVERRGEDLGRGLTRLRRQAAALAGEPVREFIQGIGEGLIGAAGAADDIALLAVRLPGAEDAPAVTARD